MHRPTLTTPALRLLAIMAFTVCTVSADWSPEDGHKMHSPQLPDPAGWDVCLLHQELADDFQCAESGSITGIHFWVSWKDDVEQFATVTWGVSIHADERGRPGETLWTWEPGDGDVVWRHAGKGDQGWYCPSQGESIPRDHVDYYQVNITGISNGLRQEQGCKYWLRIAAATQSRAQVGWKTSKSTYFEPAMARTAFAGWNPIKEPVYDLSFVITGESLDFGDAPESAVAAGYPTLLSSDGARHVIAGPWLGDKNDRPDSEPDGQPTSNASGDDSLDGNDDENGVRLGTIPVVGTTVVEFEVSGGGGYVQAWVDFNRDGQWDPFYEQAINGYFPDGTHSVTISSPQSTTAGWSFARFRISSAGGLWPYGRATDGEVEDHAVRIFPKGTPDYFEPNNRLYEAIDIGYWGQSRLGLGIHEPNEEDWNQWTAMDSGQIVVEIGYAPYRGRLKAELYSAEGVLLATSYPTEAGERLEYDVTGGQTYFTRVYGTAMEVALAYDFALIPIAPKKNFAVLFSGGIRPAKNFTRYYNNTKTLYEILVNHYRLDPNNIWVLYADGTDPGDDLTTADGLVNSDMSYASQVLPATGANLETVLTTILPAEVSASDYFFFWSFDHGGGAYNAPGTTGEETLCGWFENIDDADLADWLSQVPALRKTIVLTQCFAGGLLDDMMPLLLTETGCAATNHYESSWGDGFAAAYNDALLLHNAAYDAYRHAYNHDGYATDGEGPGGSVADHREHPWAATTRNLPIFWQYKMAWPVLDHIRPIRFVPPWEEIIIPFHLLEAAAGTPGVGPSPVFFRVESIEAGVLLKDGAPVTPGRTLVRPGEALLWQSLPHALLSESGTPLQDDVIEAFTVRAHDGATISDRRIGVPIRYVQGGELPMARDDYATVDEDANDAVVNVLANDAGMGGLWVVSASQSLRGKVRLSGGTVLYSPAAEFSGQDSFTYFMADGTGQTDSATAYVTIRPVNDPPEAYYDQFDIAPNSHDNIIDVLNNDFDAESKPLTFDPDQDSYRISAIVRQWPVHGTLTPRANGTFLYTPQPGFIGEDSFTYVAHDGQDPSNEATAVIHVFHRRASKWIEQPPEETERGIDIRIDRLDGMMRFIADDFECTSTGPLTDVFLWGSWKHDKKGAIQRIRLGIYSDDPVGRGGSDPQNLYSKPDMPLWAQTFTTEQFTERLHATVRPGEYWWDRMRQELIPAGDTEIWRVHIPIDPGKAFQQRGSREAPIIYWLEVSVETEGGQFGWKTRKWPGHYNDAAVMAVGSELPRFWDEMTYPSEHPYSALDFEDLALWSTWAVADVFRTTGIPIAVKKFQRSDGTWADRGLVCVVDGGMAGGTGHELQLSNANVEITLPYVLRKMSLRFGEYGGNCNIEINGDFRNVDNLSQVNGEVIGGVQVSVVNGFGSDQGQVHLAGQVHQFAIGGQEMFIDHITGMESIDMAFAVFTNPCINPSADLDGSGRMDWSDLAMFTDQWLWSGLPQDYMEGDFNCDGWVRFSDFAVFMSQWLAALP